MRHKQSTIAFTQGWLLAQLENAVEAAKKDGNETNIVLATQIQSQFQILDEAIDDLIKENNELQRKLMIVESAFN